MSTKQLIKNKIVIDSDKIAEFCHKWQIVEFALFGSVLRDDFCPESSDIDILVSFRPKAPWTLLDLVDMEDQLEQIFDYKVDLVERASIEQSQNPLRKKAILESLQIIYAESRAKLPERYA